MKNKIITLVVITIISTNSFRAQDHSYLISSCAPATAQADLDINNVRARIISGGDMWWDLSSAPKYEVPKGSGKHSLWAGSLWIGGFDAGNNLKVAAMTYRQLGNDFWPGPLASDATTDNSTCANYNQLWKVNKTDVAAYNSWYIAGSIGPNPVSVSAMNRINTWPAYGPEGQVMAPYYDANFDGVYDPSQGDYPGFDLNGTAACGNILYGDQAIWWVFNDNGNVHTETGATSIGLEVQAQAFAYSTNDDLNNTTFYKYKIINKSSFQLNQTYFGQWVDPDLGMPDDDYIGCDVARGLGYCYNAIATDSVYGTNPPAIGIDFLEGPFADFNDGIDNNRNGTIDEPNEKIIMSKFVYYSNDWTAYGNPSLALHYYNYLKGCWKTSASITYGGNGHTNALACSFMFPGGSDPIGWGVGGTTAVPKPQASWTEASASITPGDRRFIESAGPFTLQPGAINTITTGVIWAKATTGGSQASLQAMLNADDMAQNTFDNCFETVGIKNNNFNKTSVRVYPNPFVEQTILFFENINNEVYQLNLYDLTGKFVQSYKDITGNEFILLRNKLTTGTYIYEFTDTKNESSFGKIIVN